MATQRETLNPLTAENIVEINGGPLSLDQQALLHKLTAACVWIGRPKGCIAKAHPDEQVFTLRGQDVLYPWMVRQWARHFIMLNSDVVHTGEIKSIPQLRLIVPDHIRDKHDEAMRSAQAAEGWHLRKVPD